MVAGEQNLITQMFKRKIAFALDGLGKYAEAPNIVQSCTAYLEKTLGGHHPVTPVALAHLFELNDKLSGDSDANTIAPQ